MPGVAQRTIPAFGTTATVAVTDAESVGDAVALVAWEIEEMDLAASRFRPDSEVCALAAADGERVRVSELLFEAVSVAVAVCEWSGGVVDPTVGRCVEALGYDTDFADISDVSGSRAPRPHVACTGWRSIELDAAERTIRVPAQTLLDLGATAKALSADRAAGAVARLTGSGALVSIGGDVAVAGPSPIGGWAVGIAESSGARADEVDQVVSINAGGIASSSTQVRKWTRHGKSHHHIVDPRTGKSADGCWSLVSVAASTCVMANAASTAAVIWGQSAPMRLRLAGFPARLVSDDGAVTTVNGWPGAAPSPLVPEAVVS